MDDTDGGRQASEILERARAAKARLVWAANREQQVSALIARLEHIRLRKSMNFWPVNGTTRKIFRVRLFTAAQALGWKETIPPDWLKAGEQRGWKIQADGPIRRWKSAA
jgi:hypothetical protein